LRVDAMDSDSDRVGGFQSLTRNIGRFQLRGKTFLLPEMNRIGVHLIAATFRSFGIRAQVMETHKGLDLGNEYTSGKECYPCQITMGDILFHMEEERKRLGEAFDPENYVYFMPEADGPCRFGMYNKYQRIVLDSYKDLGRLRIGSLTSEDGYSLSGIIEEDRVRDLRKSAYFAVVVGDILDRILWRVRPYEKEAGLADAYMEKSMRAMEGAFEQCGVKKDFKGILSRLEEIIEEGKRIIDPTIPRKPLIGMVGEIYLRTHVHANQDLIRTLERYGAEVVNASIAEWMNYTSYDRLRESKVQFRLNWKQFRMGGVKKQLRRMLNFGGDLFYQEFRQKQVYKWVKERIDLPDDHKIGELEKVLKEEDLFNFDVGTEACLSIAGIIEYARSGFNGVVNVYPFTCMPSLMTSAVIKPYIHRLGIPYLDTPYDSSVQPGRESTIRTFMYQADQHFRLHGRGEK
jgi:predicted nucleotide-binding protein (sugar kinase/HSP70/actin superfamily)